MGGRGRPKGRRNVGVLKGTSQSQVKCAVCSLEKRNDKMKEHQLKLVLFDSEGNPADCSNPNYVSLSENEKKHTDYFRCNGFNRFKLPANKNIVKAVTGKIIIL